MKSKITLIVRLLMGLLFLMSGIVGLFKLYPMPPDLPEALVAFNKGMMASIYFFPFLKSIEILCALALLSGYFVPLALIVLAPIVANIVLVHAFLQPSGLPLAIAIGIGLSYLAFFSQPYSSTVKQIFRQK